MIEIPYTSPALHYAGRWTDYGDSKGAGWQGSQIRFKVSGTMTLTVKAKVLDANSSDLAFAVVNLDDGAQQYLWFSTASETFTGIKSVTLNLPNPGEHTVVMKLVGIPTSQWASVSYLRLMSIGVDDAGSVSSWGNQGRIKLGIIGDSWTAAESDWPFLLGTNVFSVYPTSFGGAKASDLNAQYNYDRSGVLNNSDPYLDAVVINSSVNDWAAGVSLSAFQADFAALVTKVRQKHPTAKLFLLQSPRNIVNNMDYDKYGAVMQTVAEGRENVVYAPVPSTVWSTFEWSNDTYHLTYNGRVAFAAFVRSVIEPYFPLSYDGELLFRTVVGTFGIPLLKGEASDASLGPCVRLPGGIYKLVGKDASQATQGNLMMIRLKSGLKAYGEPK